LSDGLDVSNVEEVGSSFDESWFYFGRGHEQFWFEMKARIGERRKDGIQDKKMMITIAWNPLRFDLVKSISKGRTFSDEYRVSKKS
jgi:hypothetical protein